MGHNKKPRQADIHSCIMRVHVGCLYIIIVTHFGAKPNTDIFYKMDPPDINAMQSSEPTFDSIFILTLLTRVLFLGFT